MDTSNWRAGSFVVDQIKAPIGVIVACGGNGPQRRLQKIPELAFSKSLIHRAHMSYLYFMVPNKWRESACGPPVYKLLVGLVESSFSMNGIVDNVQC